MQEVQEESAVGGISSVKIKVGARRKSTRTGVEGKCHRGIRLSQSGLSPLIIRQRLFYDLTNNAVSQRVIEVEGAKSYEQALAAYRQMQGQSLEGLRKERSLSVMKLVDSGQHFAFIQ